jgi:uncharacterized protein (TIGR03000 family)
MMRKMVLVLSLAGLTVLASASDAFAQHRGYDGGWGNSPGISIGVGRDGYYSPYGYYGGGGYSPYYQSYPQSYGNAYQFAPSYYNLAPSYSVNPATYNKSQPRTRQSYYPAPAAVQQPVAVTVLVPATDAQVWFQDAATTQQGMERLFHSPPLEPNQDYTYIIKARWMENGQAVNRERRVNVQAGQSITVSFRASTRENVPLPQLPNTIPRN